MTPPGSPTGVGNVSVMLSGTTQTTVHPLARGTLGHSIIADHPELKSLKPKRLDVALIGLYHRRPC